jgi:tyrosine-protein kinase Etk/Wzc
MTPPRSIIGRIAHAPFVRNPSVRRGVIIGLVTICGVLTLYPEKYRAATSLTPTDPTSLGLSGTLGQLGAVGSVFGNQAAVEVSMKIARSDYVREVVMKKLALDKRLGLSPLETHRWLNRHVDVSTLRGGIIEFELKLRDAVLAKDIVAAYGESVRAQLGTISRTQTSYKRAILVKLVEDSSDRLAKAQAAYDSFRLQTRYSSPQAAIYAAGDRIPELEALIRAKEVELNAARQFATDENFSVRQRLAEMEALQRQLNIARSVSPVQQSSVGQVVKQSTEVDKLRRDLDLAQGLYDSYKRYLQGTSVENLTSTANVRILEPAYIDSERQYNWVAVVAAVLVLLLGAAIEVYLIRPPLDGGKAE